MVSQTVRCDAIKSKLEAEVERLVAYQHHDSFEWVCTFECSAMFFEYSSTFSHCYFPNTIVFANQEHMDKLLSKLDTLRGSIAEYAIYLNCLVSEAEVERVKKGFVLDFHTWKTIRDRYVVSLYRMWEI